MSARQKCGDQSDHVRKCQRGLADLERETEPTGCSTQPDSHRDGSHLPLWGESLSRVGAARLCAASLTSRTNSSLSSATGVTSQDRPARRDDHCQGVVEWGGTHRLCTRRAGGDLSGTGALAYATRGYSRQLSKRDPGPDRGALPRIHPGLCRPLLAHCPLGAEPPFPVLRPWSKQGSNPFSRCYERSQWRIMPALLQTNWSPWRIKA